MSTAHVGDVGEARNAIAGLMYEYCDRLDAGDFEAMSHLFRHGAWRIQDDAGGTVALVGAAAVLRYFEEGVVRYDGRPSTKHVTTNIRIDVDAAAGTAVAHSYIMVLQARPTLPLQIVFAGRYRDTFAVVDGEWAFTDRLVFSDLIGDLSQHLTAGDILHVGEL